MKPYPEYKTTGLPWLPKIPKHWEIRKMKYLFSERSEKGFPDEPLLAATQNHGVIPKDLYESRTVVAQKDLHLLKLVRVGDFVISLRSFQGGIEYAYYQGIISPAYTVMIPKDKSLGIDYFRLLAKSKPFVKLLQTCVTGIREGQNVDWPTLKRNFIPIPPLDEQAKIVRYLDVMTAKIDKLIAAKKKQIALLQEKKQAVINQAVTRGLNPEVELKDSGIDWLGKIPKHWAVCPLKHFVESNLRSLPQDTEADFSFSYIDISSVGYGYIRAELEQMRFADSPSRARRLVQEGDTIISTVRTYLRSICLIDENLKDCVVSTGFSVLHPREHVHPRILNYALSTDAFINSVIQNSIGVSYPAIADSRLLSLKIALPFSQEEQTQIVDFILKETQKYDLAQSATNKEILWFQEYKNSLISSVVTGAVNVGDVMC